MPAGAAPPEPPADAIYRAWRSAQVDPDLAYEATEQIRAQAGHNVITVVESRFVEFGARFDALADRIDTLQKVLWPLVIALCVTLLSVVGCGLFALFGS